MLGVYKRWSKYFNRTSVTKWWNLWKQEPPPWIESRRFVKGNASHLYESYIPEITCLEKYEWYRDYSVRSTFEVKKNLLFGSKNVPEETCLFNLGLSWIVGPTRLKEAGVSSSDFLLLTLMRVWRTFHYWTQMCDWYVEVSHGQRGRNIRQCKRNLIEIERKEIGEKPLR